MKTKKKKGIAAWIIRWQRFGNHVELPSDPTAGILNRRISEKTVTLFMELLYANTFTKYPEDRLAYASDERHRPKDYTVSAEGGRITLLGPNPSLEARRVRNLRVIEGEFKCDEMPRPLTRYEALAQASKNHD